MGASKEAAVRSSADTHIKVDLNVVRSAKAPAYLPCCFFIFFVEAFVEVEGWDLISSDKPQVPHESFGRFLGQVRMDFGIKAALLIKANTFFEKKLKKDNIRYCFRLVLFRVA
jgi:hypothetical protein